MFAIPFFWPFFGNRWQKDWKAVHNSGYLKTVRAVHIEIVYSLDMNSYAMAIRNFIARRGVPLEIFSDYGTDLKAAEKKSESEFEN